MGRVRIGGKGWLGPFENGGSTFPQVDVSIVVFPDIIALMSADTTGKRQQAKDANGKAAKRDGSKGSFRCVRCKQITHFVTSRRTLGLMISCQNCGCRNEIPTVDLRAAKFFSVVFLILAIAAGVYLVLRFP